MASFRSVLVRAREFFIAYPKLVHAGLLFWNVFITSWATGNAFPLNSLGIDYTLNARVLISHAQIALHCPTWLIALATIALNGYVSYSSLSKAALLARKENKHEEAEQSISNKNATGTDGK